MPETATTHSSMLDYKSRIESAFDSPTSEWHADTVKAVHATVDLLNAGKLRIM